MNTSCRTCLPACIHTVHASGAAKVWRSIWPGRAGMHPGPLSSPVTVVDEGGPQHTCRVQGCARQGAANEGAGKKSVALQVAQHNAVQCSATITCLSMHVLLCMPMGHM